MEQAVLITFPLSDGDFGTKWEREMLGILGDQFAEVVSEAGVGEFDGSEVGGGEYEMFLYGPDADELFETIEPLLTGLTWPGQVVAIKRYGPPGAAEVQVTVGEGSSR